MKIWIVITIVSFLIVIYLYNIGRKDAAKEPENGTNICYPDPDEMFMENDFDEHSPENLDIEKTLAILNLQKKMNKIEKERDLQ